MVPSLTETFIEAGLNIVGRTRFCIHPQDKIAQIPIVGGTKDIQWDKVQALNPDIIILDKEENPLSMALESKFPYFATHIRDHESLSAALFQLANNFKNNKLREMALLCRELNTKRNIWHWENIPGVVQWLGRDTSQCKNIVYVIWKEPWMCATKETFIGSTINLLGGQDSQLTGGEDSQLSSGEDSQISSGKNNQLLRGNDDKIGKKLKINKYPEFKFSDFNVNETLFLFSTEPYPFLKKINELPPLPAAAIVDGESYSWFGIRNLSFLQKNDHSRLIAQQLHNDFEKA